MNARYIVGRWVGPGALCLMAGCSLFAGHAQTSEPAETSKADEEKEHDAAIVDTVRFPEGEQALAAAAPDWTRDWAKPPPTLLRAYAMDRDWSMLRTNAGAITARTAKTVLFIKGGETGLCRQLLCNLVEEEQGGKWGRPSINCVKEYTTRVSCASVEALPEHPAK